MGEFEKMVDENEDTMSEPFEEDLEEKQPLNLAQDKITKDEQPPQKRCRKLTIEDYEKEDAETNMETYEARHLKRMDKNISDVSDQRCC
jgi:hypothetical protein